MPNRATRPTSTLIECMSQHLKRAGIYPAKHVGMQDTTWMAATTPPLPASYLPSCGRDPLVSSWQNTRANDLLQRVAHLGAEPNYGFRFPRLCFRVAVARRLPARAPPTTGAGRLSGRSTSPTGRAQKAAGQTAPRLGPPRLPAGFPWGRARGRARQRLRRRRGRRCSLAEAGSSDRAC